MPIAPSQSLLDDRAPSENRWRAALRLAGDTESAGDFWAVQIATWHVTQRTGLAFPLLALVGGILTSSQDWPSRCGDDRADSLAR